MFKRTMSFFIVSLLASMPSLPAASFAVSCGASKIFDLKTKKCISLGQFEKIITADPNSCALRGDSCALDGNGCCQCSGNKFGCGEETEGKKPQTRVR